MGTRVTVASGLGILVQILGLFTGRSAQVCSPRNYNISENYVQLLLVPYRMRSKWRLFSWSSLGVLWEFFGSFLGVLFESYLSSLGVPSEFSQCSLRDCLWLRNF